MALLTVQNLEGNLNEITFTPADVAGDTFLNDGRTIFLVKNGTTPVTATVTPVNPNTTKPAYGDVVVETRAITVADDTIGALESFPKAPFNDSIGNVLVTYDAIANVEVAAVKVNKGV